MEPLLSFICVALGSLFWLLAGLLQSSLQKLHHRLRRGPLSCTLKSPHAINWLVKYSILTYFLLSVASVLYREDDDGPVK